MSNSGVLLIDKPSNMTSHDLVNIARKAFNTKKVGHNGTLDPDATGVMVLCIGQATRLNEYLVSDDKCYQTTLVFGSETNTQDISGEIIKKCSLPVLTENEFSAVLNRFIGVQEQTPPLYSAIKRNGKPLYKYAREGKTVEDIPKRKIEIFSLECLSFNNEKATFNVHCSKGTYIRTLCQDIARACGSCGCMAELRRTKAGMFSLEECIDIDTLKTCNDPVSLLMPMSKALIFPKISVEEAERRDDLFNGKRIQVEQSQIIASESGWYQAVINDDLLAIGKIEDGCFIPKKVFHG